MKEKIINIDENLIKFPIEFKFLIKNFNIPKLVLPKEKTKNNNIKIKKFNNNQKYARKKLF